MLDRVGWEAKCQVACPRIGWKIFDMDGVLYRGDSVIPEAPVLIEALQTAGIPLVMATNNSTATPDGYVAKLQRMGMHVSRDALLTSALATGQYLRRTCRISS